MKPGNTLRHFLLALQFFTRIPVTGRLARWVGFSPALQRASMGHFPGIGLLLGATAAAVFALVAWLLGGGSGGMLVAAILSTGATVWLTGVLHEDGLADVADGLAGGHNPAHALAIMKDSRIGAAGAVALLLALQAKVALLGLLGTQSLAAALVALVGAHGLSRVGPVLLTHRLPYVSASDTAKSQGIAGARSRHTLWVALAWGAVSALGVAWYGGLVFLALACLAAALAWLALWHLFARRLQGYTGDCLGATQQVCEIAFYLGAAVAVAQGHLAPMGALPW
jgi:adenosylcobinamide-GDP ribazoletransferase